MKLIDLNGKAHSIFFLLIMNYSEIYIRRNIEIKHMFYIVINNIWLVL